jgi:hypothetical protein
MSSKKPTSHKPKSILSTRVPHPLSIPGALFFSSNWACSVLLATVEEFAWLVSKSTRRNSKAATTTGPPAEFCPPISVKKTTFCGFFAFCRPGRQQFVIDWSKSVPSTIEVDVQFAFLAFDLRLFAFFEQESGGKFEFH